MDLALFVAAAHLIVPIYGLIWLGIREERRRNQALLRDSIRVRDRMKLRLRIEMDKPAASTPPPLSIEEKVEAALDLIDSGHESREEWCFIKKLNNYLMRLDKLNPRQERILNQIQPIMEKYGQMSSSKTEQKAEHTTVTNRDG